MIFSSRAIDAKTAGRVYGGGLTYEKGVFRGKRAMLSLTAGSCSGWFGGSTDQKCRFFVSASTLRPPDPLDAI